MWLFLFVMRFLKSVGIFVVFLFFVFVFIFFWGGFSIGNVIWEPSVVGNCVDSEILDLWDEVFVESGVDVVILKDFVVEGDCNEYIAYKNNSDGEFWVLYGNFYNSSWISSVDLYSSGNKILDFVRLSLFYMNVSSDFADVFVGQGNVSGMIDVILGIGSEDIDDWSVLSEGDVKIKFGELYEFVDVSGILFNSDVSTFYFSESDVFDFDFSYVSIVSRKNDALFNCEYWRDSYDPGFFVDFLGNIGDFRFLINSSWNFAFDYGDYFNVSDNVSVGFDYVGIGNSNGEKINYSINGTNVGFMPAVGFGGSIEFRLVARSGAEDVVSNNFSVNVTRYNEAPVLVEAIPFIYVVAGGNGSVDLDRYFDDVDDLVYGASGVRGIDVSFSGPIMRIDVDSNFSGYSKFRVYASDGLDSTFSDYVYVVLEGDESVLLIQNDSLNVSVGGVSDNGNIIDNWDGDEDNEGFGLWFWVVLWVVVLVVIGGVLYLVYFFMIRGAPSSVGDQNIIAPNVVSPAEEYVRKLGLGGG